MGANENMLVSLDALVIKEDETSQQVEPQKEILLKKVPSEYRERIVKDLVVYMVEPASDGLNGAYNENERQVAALIKSWMDAVAAGIPKAKFGVMAKPARGGEPIVISLDKKVSAYEVEIFQSRPVPGGDPSVTFPFLELYAKGGLGGAAVLYFALKQQFTKGG